MERNISPLALSGLAAGLSMGFSLVAEALLQVHLPDAPWTPLITKLGYSIGFLIVILGRQQLFTKNTLTVILLRKRKPMLLVKVARLWTIVLLTNLIGAFAFAWLLRFAESARIWVIIILAYLVGLAGHPHVIAGNVETFYLVSTKALSFGDCLTGYLIPTLIGNVIGGVALVAAGAHPEFVEVERMLK